MGEEKPKKKWSIGKCLAALVFLAVLAYGGWFAYAKATGNPDC